MIFKPVKLGRDGLTEQELQTDRKKSRNFGPCGVGEKALYLNSFYIDRRYYIPFTSVTRVFKRVAMSRGGFSGKGMFATIPYLVVEYDDGKEKQCNFKYEENVDRMLACIGKFHPEIRLVSRAAEERLKKREQERAERFLPELSKEAQGEAGRLQEAREYLEIRPELGIALSQSARRKRAYDKSSPSYKWVALAISLLGAASLIYGIYSLINHVEFAVYFTLFGMAAIFLFSGASMLPTSRNNRTYILNRVRLAKEEMEEYLKGYGGKSGFPVPARYAHPVVLKRMIEIIMEGRAECADNALEVLKEDLRALNSDVQVEQEEYEEVVAIKAMFLNEDYR